ncbi:MAG: hypothetical protein OXC44_08045 [Proteobacteria bacterium]|nr:hypothetical protein [Pseudomonadota bacterium]
MNDEFVSYGNTFKIDHVFNHQKSFALMDYFGSTRGLCGFFYDSYNPEEWSEMYTLRSEAGGVREARKLDYTEKSRSDRHGKCQIVCEHSVQDLASSFERRYMPFFPMKSMNPENSMTVAEGRDIAQRIRAKFDAFKDSHSCEIHSFQSWKEKNNRVTHDAKEELAWMRFGDKLYINHFEKDERNSGFYRDSKVIPFADYTYLYAGVGQTRYRNNHRNKEAVDNNNTEHTLHICSRYHEFMSGPIRSRETSNNTNKFKSYMDRAYEATLQTKDMFLAEDLSGKCMRVCNITEGRRGNPTPTCSVKRVGREYIKLHEFFGGLKASFCSVGEREDKIEGFIEEIKGAKNTFSQWNPGMLSPKDGPEGNEIEFAVERNVTNINSHDFDGPIQSIELKDGPGNEDNFVASIEVGKDQNNCVIKALNRYIHTSSKTNELRLMIHKAHFAAESCVPEGELYLKALRKLEASQESEDDKSDKIFITFKKEKDEQP